MMTFLPRNQILFITAALSLLSSAAAQAQEGPAAVETRMVEVDGYAVHVYTAGWEHLERGQPVVVFESGGFSTLGGWGELPSRLAQETAVVAYDRAGFGGSEWDGQRPTIEHVVSRLRATLETLGAPPPYLFVGHSMGGPKGLAMARMYPELVAGLVLVDPTPPAADWLAAFDDIGVGRKGHVEFVELMSRAFEGSPESMQVALEVLLHYMSEADALPWSPPEVSVPVAVLLAGGGYEVPQELPSSWDVDRQHEALLLRQIANYAEWTRTVPDANIILANNSRHCIHCWDPDLVLSAIRRVLYPDIRVQLREAVAKDGPETIGPLYAGLKNRYPPERFDEDVLDRLGRELLMLGNTNGAIPVFELNVREFSEAAGPHNSLADAYGAAGHLEDARAGYQRAVEAARANEDPRLAQFERSLARAEQRITGPR